MIRGMPCSTVNVIASKAAAHHLPDLSSALGCDDLARNMNVAGFVPVLENLESHGI